MGIFKAYDIRGKESDGLTAEMMYKIGRATAKLLAVPEIIVGRDARLTSDLFFDAYARGLNDEGVSVVDAGLVTTPLLYFAVGKYAAPAGAMITASHNPKEYNGLKIVKEGVIPLSTEEIQILESLVNDHPEWDFSSSAKEYDVPSTISTLLEDYRVHINNVVDVNGLKPFNILVDCANGAGGIAFESVFDSSTQNVTALNVLPDGNFPAHEPNPLIIENRQQIIGRMKEGGFDIGVAFDGDADRVFFFDEQGNFLSGDFVTAILSEELLELNPGANIVYDLRASWAVPDKVSQAGGHAHMIRVGHTFFKARMRELDAVFAGEVTGHYYFKTNYYAEDGLLPLILLLKKMSSSGKSLSEILSAFDSYHISGEINYTVDDADKKIDALKEKYADCKQTFIDGISIDSDDWHCNVRKSNTEPLLRLNLEAKSKEKLDMVLIEIESIIQS